jgi:tRNA (guanine37-N1)-methyltransferase
MLAAYTKLQNAQKVKKFLLKNNLLNPDYLPVKEIGIIYFPITKKIKVPNAKVVNTKFKFPQREKPVTVNELLKSKLTKKELSLLPKSQEVVGTIMVIGIPDELKKKEKIIAEAYLKTNKHITTVVKKDRIHSGVYRTRTVKILAGKRSKETIHQENKVKIKLHLEKTYFSARSANERLRLAKQVKKGEQVLVMFSGAAPFPLVLARNSEAKKIYGIEINPLAHQYARENLELNNLKDKIVLYSGNVTTILPKMKRKFDRIAMPLPKTGEEFLGLVLRNSKPGTIIHLYDFLNERDFNKQAKNIKHLCEQEKHKVKILRKVKCGQFSPKVFRVCFDLKVLN